MNKSRMKTNAWSHVRIRPVAKRFYGADGPPLPPVDDDWLIQGVEDAGVRISNNHTGHGTLLAWDQIHHYATDLDRGDRHGFLILNTQVNIGGNSLWCEPTFRPGEALPDQFGDVRGWKRENDPLYVQSLYARLPQAPLPPAPQPVSGSGAALLVGLCLGVGLLIANA
jgi:hypothetical protein